MNGILVTFGEIMGRLTTPGFSRIEQALPGQLNVEFGGAEANVAVSVNRLGGTARYMTALPGHAIGDACIAALKQQGVDTRFVLRTDIGRLGLYFVEVGASQRPSTVVYDRDETAISRTPAANYAWDKAFDGARWFHVTGITPAISEIAAQTTAAAASKAKEKGLLVSCDLNFRSKLWNWREGSNATDLARETMRDLLPNVDVVIANEEDAAITLGIHAEESDVQAGQLAVNKYPAVAKEIVRQFPNVQRVAITLRESLSASHNRWGAMLYDAQSDQPFFAPVVDGQYAPYDITHIVDRVGAGDSFAAGLIFASCTPGIDQPEDIVRFATSASCLAHSIQGDFNYSTRQDVENLMHGSGSGRVVR
jgi:2-dehydro-3-deoxygluconokinase